MLSNISSLIAINKCLRDKTNKSYLTYMVCTLNIYNRFFTA